MQRLARSIYRLLGHGEDSAIRSACSAATLAACYRLSQPRPDPGPSCRSRTPARGRRCRSPGGGEAPAVLLAACATANLAVPPPPPRGSTPTCTTTNWTSSPPLSTDFGHRIRRGDKTRETKSRRAVGPTPLSILVFAIPRMVDDDASSSRNGPPPKRGAAAEPLVGIEPTTYSLRVNRSGRLS